jgi:hypothetical protein
MASRSDALFVFQDRGSRQRRRRHNWPLQAERQWGAGEGNRARPRGQEPVDLFATRTKAHRVSMCGDDRRYGRRDSAILHCGGYLSGEWCCQLLYCTVVVCSSGDHPCIQADFLVLARNADAWQIVPIYYWHCGSRRPTGLAERKLHGQR